MDRSSWRPEDEPAVETEDGAGEEDGAPSSEPKPEEAPAAPPFTPMHPLRAGGYILAGLTLALTQGVGQAMISTNLTQIQGGFGATQAETAWLSAAYLAPNVSLTLMLIKIRNQFGLRRFAEVSIVGFLIASLLNHFIDGFNAALALRFMSGIAAAPMTSLAFLYILEPLPPHRKMNFGLATALTALFIGSPVTGLISPHLLEVGLWRGLTAMEAALAMIGFGLIYLLPLRTPAAGGKIQLADVVSYLFIAVGFGAVAVAFTLGPIYWWLEAAWIGPLLAVGVASVAIAVVIELNRKSPLLDIRWLMSREMLHFTGVLLLFRLVLSEQTSGAIGMFRAFGLLNDQFQGLFLVMLGAAVAGGVICAFFLKPERTPAFHAVALALLAAGAWLDSHSNAQSVPAGVYLSQAMIGLSSALFLPPALLSGLGVALAKGRDYILSFVIVFLTTQKIGGVLGGALFSTFVKYRQSIHLQRLTEQLSVADPLVDERLAVLGGAYRAVTSDAGAVAGQAAALLKGQASTQATALAYDDAFRVVAIVSAIALAGLLAHIGLRALRKWGAADPSRTHSTPEAA